VAIGLSSGDALEGSAECRQVQATHVIDDVPSHACQMRRPDLPQSLETGRREHGLPAAGIARAALKSHQTTPLQAIDYATHATERERAGSREVTHAQAPAGASDRNISVE
jgi:hypothetical protein